MISKVNEQTVRKQHDMKGELSHQIPRSQINSTDFSHIVAPQARTTRSYHTHTLDTHTHKCGWQCVNHLSFTGSIAVHLKSAEMLSGT